MTAQNRLLSLALLSCSSLMLEITLTRLLAALYYPPYVFAVLALAVLGIGLGAALATVIRRLHEDRHLPGYSLLAGLMTLVALIVTVLAAPADLQIVILIVASLPFLFVGLALATLFRSQAANRLYMADLVGAGLGAILALPLMDTLGPINALLVIAAGFGLAGVLMSTRNLPLPQLALLLLAILGLGSNLALGWLMIDFATLPTVKPINEAIAQGGTIIDTRWQSFSRTDLVQPSDNSPLRLYIDGAAGSLMPAPDDRELLFSDIGFFPFAVGQPERAMVIGPGGGLDVWFALESGAQEIVAVEVNPASVTIVEDYADINGGLYDRLQVRVVVDEGRSVLRREAVRYDLISLSQVVTLAAERSGYALSENTIYTVEAFHDYLDHLTDTGQIAIKLYDELTLTRTLSTALAAFRERGLSDVEALQHTAAFLDPRVDPPIPLLIVSQSPFSREDALVYGGIAREIGFVPLYLPHVLAQPPLDAIEAGTQPFEAIIADSNEDISPTTDDRPFFYQFERGIPATLVPLLLAVGGVLVVGIVWLIFRQRRVETRSLRWSPLYFAGLGVGFIAVEIAILQQTRLFIGHPSLAVTVVLATLLIGGGIGSYVAGRWLKARMTPTRATLLVAVMVAVWIVGWPLLSQQFLALPQAGRIVVAILSLLPLALVMGIPFPTGLSLMDDPHVSLAWATNGVMTVAGTVAAVTLAILGGYTTVLLVGAACYLLLAALAYIGRFQHSR